MTAAELRIEAARLEATAQRLGESTEWMDDAAQAGTALAKGRALFDAASKLMEAAVLIERAGGE